MQIDLPHRAHGNGGFGLCGRDCGLGFRFTEPVRLRRLLQALQEEALNRLNTELAAKVPGGKVPEELKSLLPKLGDLFN